MSGGVFASRNKRELLARARAALGSQMFPIGGFKFEVRRRVIC